MPTMRTSSDRSATLDYLTVYPAGYTEEKAFPLVICLHGFGANKQDLSGLAPVLDADRCLYVLPDGPLAAANEPEVRAWYERGGKESPAAVRDALAALDGFVTDVLARFRVAPGRCVLLGFSQGGAMALRYGLPRPEVFAGLAILSGSLRQLDDLLPSLPSQRTQPLFVAHGLQDALVPCAWSQSLVTFLEGQGYRPRYKTYPMGHTISPAVIADLRKWFEEVWLGNEPAA